MRRTLLLAAALGSFAMLAAPASAGDYRPHHPQVTSSFHLGVFVAPAPRSVHYYHPRPWHLRPQPVYRYAPPPPRPKWHHWHRPPVRYFDWRHHGRSEWRHDRHDWRHDRSGWRHDRAEWRDRDHDRRHGGGWRDGDRDRRHDNQWRDRSGRDHARNDRGRH